MSEYNNNEIDGELEDILNSAFNNYIQEEYKYQEACVKLFETTVANEPEVRELISLFTDTGCTEVKAKTKVIEYMLNQYE